MSGSGQNTSSAVMQQRDRSRSSLDYYPTPPWVGRVLCDDLEKRGLKASAGQGNSVHCWEPAFGSGDLARGLAPYFDGMLCSDIHQHPRIANGMRAPILGDFLIDELWREEEGPTRADWIITNPPFKLGSRFVETALRRSEVGVAMFVRSAFLESAARLRDLFRPHPPALVLQFAERVPLFEGKLRDPDREYWDAMADNGKDENGDPLPKGKWRRPSTATAYCWVVWRHDAARTEFGWIPPCRRAFTKDGDYPAPDAPPHSAARDLLSGVDRGQA